MASEIQGLRTVEIKKVTGGAGREGGGRKQCKPCWLHKHLHRCFPRSYLAFYPVDSYIQHTGEIASQSLLAFLIIVLCLKSHCWHKLYCQKQHQYSPGFTLMSRLLPSAVSSYFQKQIPLTAVHQREDKSSYIYWAFSVCWTLLCTPSPSHLTCTAALCEWMSRIHWEKWTCSRSQCLYVGVPGFEHGSLWLEKVCPFHFISLPTLCQFITWFSHHGHDFFRRCFFSPN